MPPVSAAALWAIPVSNVKTIHQRMTPACWGLRGWKDNHLLTIPLREDYLSSHLLWECTHTSKQIIAFPGLRETLGRETS